MVLLNETTIEGPSPVFNVGKRRLPLRLTLTLTLNLSLSLTPTLTPTLSRLQRGQAQVSPNPDPDPNLHPTLPPAPALPLTPREILSKIRVFGVRVRVVL